MGGPSRSDEEEAIRMAICEWCSGEMSAVVSCTTRAFHRDGRTIEMVPWGRESGWSAQARCHDCGVMPSRFHHPGCDIQECPLCGGQMLSCGCRFDEDGPEDEEGGDVEIEITVPDLNAVGGIVVERWVDDNGCPTERRLLEGGIEVLCHEDAIPESDRAIVDGIPCTTALRTIIDLAAGVDPSHLERMVRNALDRSLFTLDEAAARVSQPDISGRPGALLLGELLRRWEGDCAI